MNNMVKTRSNAVSNKNKTLRMLKAASRNRTDVSTATAKRRRRQFQQVVSDGESLNESLNSKEKQVLSLMQHKSVEETTNEEDTDEANFEQEGKDSVSGKEKTEEEGKDSSLKEVNDEPAGDGEENEQCGGVNEAKDKADGDGLEKDGSEEALDDLTITEEADIVGEDHEELGDPEALSVAECQKSLELSKYNFKTYLDFHPPFPAKVSVRSSMKKFFKFKEDLQTSKLLEAFRNTCFGHFLSLSEHWTHFNGKLVHSLLLRKIGSAKLYEIWCILEGKPICFGLREFALVTGLYCGEYPSQDELDKVHLKGEKFYQKVTKGYYGGVSGDDVLELMKSTRFNAVGRHKLSLVWFVHSILVARDDSTHVDKNWIKMAYSLDVFLNFPWGRESFELTIQYLRKDVVPPSVEAREGKKRKRNGKTSPNYSLFGFPWAFMAWALEAIPSVGQLAIRSSEKPLPLPRMLRWLNPKAASYGDAFQQRVHGEMVHPFLYPTVREARQKYVSCVKSFDDEELEDGPIDRLRAVLEGVTSIKNAADDIETVSSGSDDNRTLKQASKSRGKQVVGMTVGTVGKFSWRDAGHRGDGEGTSYDNVICNHCGRQNNDALMKKLESMELKLDEVYKAVSMPQKRVLHPSQLQRSPFGVLTRLRKKKALDSAAKEKKSKLKKVDVFKPVKLADKKAFYEWLERRETVTRKCLTGFFNWEYFEKLRRMGPWVEDDHIDELMALMRLRQKEYPRHYDQSSVIVDLLFCQCLTEIWKELRLTSEKDFRDFDVMLSFYQFDSCVMDYHRGAQPTPYGRNWAGAKKLYCVWNMENKHFVTIEFLLEEALIKIYDCNWGCYSDEAVGMLVQPIAELMPKYLKQSGKFEHLGDDVVLNPWTWRRVLDVPVNEQAESCGAYALKFIDFLLTNTSMDNLHDNTVEEFREKFAIEIFNGRMEP